jgi:GNAT acetyltransferase-like protein
VICYAIQVLGYISFSPIREYLFVDAGAVLPRVHRQGLGTQLLAFAEKETLRLGLRSVRLFTNGRITGNLFYRQRGYRETGCCHEGSFSRVFTAGDRTSLARLPRGTSQPVRRPTGGPPCGRAEHTPY